MSLPEHHTQRVQNLGTHLLRMRQRRTFAQMQASTGLSRPTLIAAEQGNDMQVSTLLRILEAHGCLVEFDRLVAALGRAADAQVATRNDNPSTKSTSSYEPG